MFEGKVVRLSEHCSLIVESLDFRSGGWGGGADGRNGRIFRSLSDFMFGITSEWKWTLFQEEIGFSYEVHSDIRIIRVSL